MLCRLLSSGPQGLVLGVALCFAPLAAAAQVPTHPILTEAFVDPLGTDGPVGANPANLHQEFIEIYLPLAADLEAGLSKDALNLTLYDIEGDFSSTHVGQANWRIDLPPFDLDDTNGITPGAVARPSSGVVVLGWLKYFGDPPTDLRGTPATRIPMVNVGNTPVGFTFVGINGNQFGGTTNYPTPVAISYLDLVTNPYTGLFENGSGALLLMNRDHASYVELCSFADPAPCNSDADLPNGSNLPVAALLDAFAPNDDAVFNPAAQPYLPPTGQAIDLEFVLRLGGAYSIMTPQVEELGEGYERKLVDVQKTTEDAIVANESPAIDHQAYRVSQIFGPFLPTPGVVTFGATPASLSVQLTSSFTKDILVGTTARPSPNSANLGGNFSMTMTTAPSESPDAPNITVAPWVSASAPFGREPVFPEVEVTVAAGAPVGETTSVFTRVTAVPTGLGDPPLGSAGGFGIMNVRAIDPTTGVDSVGSPFQATALIAVQGFEDDPLVANEFAASHLGQYLANTVNIVSTDSEGKLATLVSPTTNMVDDLVVDRLISSLPDAEAFFMNEAGPVGKKDLVQTVSSSAEVLAGGTAYGDTFNVGGNLINARRFTINSANGATRTSGSFYSPANNVHYISPDGRLDQGSGFWNVTTNRNFELAILDTNVQGIGLLESGSADDFGVIVKAGTVRLGSPVVPGEFIFLSMMGGREGADVDTLDVLPFSPTLMSVVLIDLDHLDTVLGVETITDVYIVDGNGGSRIDPLEVFSLNLELVPEPGGRIMLLSGVVLLAGLAPYRRTGS